MDKWHGQNLRGLEDAKMVKIELTKKKGVGGTQFDQNIVMGHY